MGSPGGGTGGSFKTPQASKAVKSAGTVKSPYKGGAVTNGGGDYEAISDSDDKDADRWVHQCHDLKRTAKRCS